MMYFIFSDLLIVLNFVGFIVNGGELTQSIIGGVSTLIICVNITFIFFAILMIDCDKNKKY